MKICVEGIWTILAPAFIFKVVQQQLLLSVSIYVTTHCVVRLLYRTVYNTEKKSFCQVYMSSHDPFGETLNMSVTSEEKTKKEEERHAHPSSFIFPLLLPISFKFLILSSF